MMTVMNEERLVFNPFYPDMKLRTKALNAICMKQCPKKVTPFSVHDHRIRRESH